MGLMNKKMVDEDEIPLQQERFVNRNGTLKKDKGVSITQLAITVLGGRCIKCGYYDDKRALQIDHIHSDGNLERTRFTVQQIATLIHKAYIYNLSEALEIVHDRYQVLCANCNKIKQVERQEDGCVFLDLKNIHCIERVRGLRYLITEFELKQGYIKRRI